MTEEESNYVVIGIDVISYSLKELKDQVASQRIVDRCLEEAIVKHWKWSQDDIHWIDAGDGGFLLLNGHNNVVIDTVASFQGKIEEEVDNWNQDKKLHLRYAIHCDLVKKWPGKFGTKYTGHALNNCARLLNSMNKEQFGQVICSRNFLQTIETFGNIKVEKQRLTDIVDKHGVSHERFNLYRIPGLGVPALEREISNDPTER